MTSTNGKAAQFHTVMVSELQIYLVTAISLPTHGASESSATALIRYCEVRDAYSGVKTGVQSNREGYGKVVTTLSGNKNNCFQSSTR